LAAEGRLVEDDDGEALGSGIDRGGEAGRPAADDRHVVELLPRCRPHHAEPMGEIMLRRIAEDRAIGRDDERQLIGIGFVAREQRRRFRVRVGIEHLMRLAVAGQEIVEAQEVSVVGRADQDRPADGGLGDQIDSAQDQRAGDALAELGLGDEHGAEPVGRDEDDLDLALGTAVDKGVLARQLPDLGEELAGALVDQLGDMAEPVMLRDRDLAGEDDEHARAGLAGLEQRLAIGVAADLAETAQAVDLLRRQLGESLLISLEGCHPGSVQG
jgi:hypothetical protein